MSLGLRRLTPADARAWRTLRIEAFTLHPRDYRSTAAEEAAMDISVLERIIARQIALGLFDGETLVGTGVLSLESRAKLAHRGEIRGVYVRGAFRGAGAGERLMKALIEEARDKVTVVFLTVSDGNGPALRLYTRLGFTPYAFEPGALKLEDGTLVDEIAMVRRLDDGTGG
ncbi:MAG TPA: GNAT family N-acetyltransferase [Caulobacteraceae bacterium]